MTKIEALQKTIYNLENDVYEYCWSNTDTCNCGVLARTIMGGKKPSEAGFSDSPKMDYRFTTFANRAYCLTTNLKLPEVFETLNDAGFLHKELLELENLSNQAVLSRLGLEAYPYSEYFNIVKNCLRSDKSTLIKYLKAWVEILQEEVGQNVQVSVQVEYPDLTQSLAVLPIEETSDVVKVKEVVK